jgi:acetylornithine/LysW-gamma-L-lysine aminotransferase
MPGFVFSEKPIRLVRGDGPYLYDDAETEYLDAGASYACVPLGHRHPGVRRAIDDQLDRLTYVQGSYPVASRTELYDLLAEVAPGDLDDVWLCNSGTEANEAALKFARHATGRSGVVAAVRGFHGRTMGALAATWNQEYRQGFEPFAGDVSFVPYDDVEALTEAVTAETAAVILEPIQGEGGVNPATVEYLQAARDFTADAGAALVLDEVQCGLGRTGRMWACEKSGVVPDVLTAAKGLANGFPVGATVVREWVAQNAGSHGGTFSGGPVMCAAAVETVRTIRDTGLPAHAADVGGYLRGRLERELGDVVREVRGAGLMVGVEVKTGATTAARDLALDQRVLVIPTGRTVLRYLPPLTIEHEHADRLVDATVAVADRLTV